MSSVIVDIYCWLAAPDESNNGVLKVDVFCCCISENINVRGGRGTSECHLEEEEEENNGPCQSTAPPPHCLKGIQTAGTQPTHQQPPSHDSIIVLVPEFPTSTSQRNHRLLSLRAWRFLVSSFQHLLSWSWDQNLGQSIQMGLNVEICLWFQVWNEKSLFMQHFHHMWYLFQIYFIINT